MSGQCAGCRGRLSAPRRTLCIHTARDLDLLLRTWNRYDTIILAGVLGPDDGPAWERRLFALYDDCGCDAGGIALLLVLSVIAWLLMTRRAHGDWHAAALAIAACLGAALFGKLAGILIARIRLWRDVRYLRCVILRLVDAAGDVRHFTAGSERRARIAWH
ncbi:MAG TPA: hypothetical protein VJZ76_00685 [Thermoanaerobaculia bacterium]|nr:hypothetical protein [Thermoanaerobaculia bacterium]